MTKPQNEYYRHIAEKLIEQLKNGIAPWQKPWQEGRSLFPYNPVSGIRYRGGNTIALMAQAIDRGYEDSRWMTYEQAKSLSGQVRKGEKGSLLRFYKFAEDVPVKDRDGRPVQDENGEKLTRSIKLDAPKVISFVVFNASQIEGLASEERLPGRAEWEVNERAESILSASGAKISFGGERAYYSYRNDEIKLPPRERFKSDSGYYATALHEVGHWTGHCSRLDRDMKHPFGSIGYAKEELRAEIFSMMLGSEIGLGHDPGNHAAYVNSWIKVLQDDHREIFRAAADAEKMMGHVFELEKRQDLKAQQDLNVMTEPTLHALPNEAENGNSAPSQVTSKITITESRFFLAVPYKERGQAKALGAKWDRDQKSWYVPAGMDSSSFEKWHKPHDGALASSLPSEVASERVYIAVPYLDRSKAKALGATWDKEQKSWCVEPGGDLSRFEKWIDKKLVSSQMDPREEFSLALKDAGLLLEGPPVMDGSLQRVQVEGGKQGNRDGAYTGHLDGRPSGYIENFKTGFKENWKAQGFSLSDEERTKLHAEAAQKLEKRKQEQEEARAIAAERASEFLRSLSRAHGEHPYIAKKGLNNSHGSLINPEDKALIIPACDINGKVWSYQKISEDGSKSFAPGGRIEGCMFVAIPSSISEADGAKPKPFLRTALKTEQIFIAEGFATAATLAEALKKPVIAAFSAGNLLEVATALRSKAPDADIVICGDDDKATELKTSKNPGRDKALAAASAVSGRALFPNFGPGPHLGSDFNDLYRAFDLQTVNFQIRSTTAPKREIFRGKDTKSGSGISM